MLEPPLALIPPRELLHLKYMGTLCNGGAERERGRGGKEKGRERETDRQTPPSLVPLSSVLLPCVVLSLDLVQVCTEPSWDDWRSWSSSTVQSVHTHTHTRTHSDDVWTRWCQSV